MTEQTLQALAAAGAPSVLAPPDLAQRIVAQHRRSTRRRRLGASIALAGLAAGGAVAARSTGDSRFYEIYMPSPSMTPTVGVGEHLLADRSLKPEHEDVVQLVIRNNGGASLQVKRVIGLPGDVIACPAGADGYCHAWTRNGRALSESWVGRDKPDAPGSSTPQPGFFVDLGTRIAPFPDVAVTPDHVFVLGDNRDNSVDSRTTYPSLQELADVKGVGVQVIGAGGSHRSIPGAPPHEGPGDGRNIDPPGPLPTANSSGVVPKPSG
jgi:signal peptidase I